MTKECSKTDIRDKAASVINDYIKQKESKLREKREEFGSTPSRYVVANVIKEEIDTLSEEIDSMKKLVNDLKCDQ